MNRVALAALVSTDPVIIAALLGGAALALYLATREGRGPRRR